MKRASVAKRFGITLAITSTVLSAPAFATYSCEGHVVNVGVAPGTGIVILTTDNGFGSVYICQVDTTSSSANGPVTPEQCKSFLAVFLAAQTTGQRIQFAFNDSLTCSTHPSWAWLGGWYFGPMLLSN